MVYQSGASSTTTVETPIYSIQHVFSHDTESQLDNKKGQRKGLQYYDELKQKCFVVILVTFIWHGLPTHGWLFSVNVGTFLTRPRRTGDFNHLRVEVVLQQKLDHLAVPWRVHRAVPPDDHGDDVSERGDAREQYAGLGCSLPGVALVHYESTKQGGKRSSMVRGTARSRSLGGSTRLKNVIPIYQPFVFMGKGPRVLQFRLVGWFMLVV